MLLSAVINQKPVHISRRPVQWETFLRLTDFHNIIAPIYHGILGIEKEVSEDFQERFYQKYKKEILLGDTYRDVEEVILWQLERHQIRGLLLSGTGLRRLYPKWEWGYTDAIELLVDKKSLSQIREFMLSMDYEETENRLGPGLLFVRVPGVRIIFYDKVPVRSKAIYKYLTRSAKKAQRVEGLRYLYALREEEEYLYRIGRLVNDYITGDLKIRTILDFWQYITHIEEGFPWSAVEEVLEKAKLVKFVDQVQILASLWFGSRQEREIRLALSLEEYIVSQGRVNASLDAVILPHERTGLDFYRRNREREWKAKQKQWTLFPSVDYMQTYYPILKRFPFLLVFCWISRWARILRNRFLNFQKRQKEALQQKVASAREKFQRLFRKKQEEPEEEEIVQEGFLQGETIPVESSGEELKEEEFSEEEVLELLAHDDKQFNEEGETDVQ